MKKQGRYHTACTLSRAALLLRGVSSSVQPGVEQHGMTAHPGSKQRLPFRGKAHRDALCLLVKRTVLKDREHCTRTRGAVCRIEPGLKGIAKSLGSVLKCLRSRDVGGGAHQIGEKLDDQLLVPSRTR